jgi:tetratricopeptide (TPR) repeat protein
MIERLRLNALFNKAARFAERGDFDVALRHFDAVVEADPTDPLAQNNRGFCLYHLGKHDEAIAAYQRAIELDRENPSHAYDLACIHHKIGDTEKAVDLLRKTVRNHPDFQAAQEALAGLTGEPVSDSAPETPADLEAAEQHVDEAFDHFEGGRFDKALAAFDKAVEAGLNDAKMQNNRAAALIELKRYKDALAACDAALGFEPRYAVAHLTRGEVLVLLKREGEARAELAYLKKADEDKAALLKEMIEGGND